ncbi:hypothetical protein TH8_08560 [Thalassospira profundimaris]|nr:hypothetical protein TH8_08560 [Thalassospira profundimaris]
MLDWRKFYEDRQTHYKEILRELGEHDDEYSRWYKSGGYGYDPIQARKWILEETSLSEFRGTCLDIGSGDGFWTWILSEWFHVTGIDPVEGGVELAEAIKKRLPKPIQRRVDFQVGDALDVKDVFDVVFCRAPSFFNYPIYKPTTPDMFDLDRSKLVKVWRENKYDEKIIAEKLKAYPPAESGPQTVQIYEQHWREYLEKMLSITNKVFIFILSTKEDYYGQYIGDTYNHDPEEIKHLFSEYGEHNVYIDSTNTYIVGELYK